MSATKEQRDRIVALERLVETLCQRMDYLDPLGDAMKVDPVCRAEEIEPDEGDTAEEERPIKISKTMVLDNNFTHEDLINVLEYTSNELPLMYEIGYYLKSIEVSRNPRCFYIHFIFERK